MDAESLELNTAFYQVEMVAGGKSGWISVLVPSSQFSESEADPLCRVTGPRMNPSVDVGACRDPLGISA